MTSIVAPAAAVLVGVERVSAPADTLSGAGPAWRRLSTGGSRSAEGARGPGSTRYRERDPHLPGAAGSMAQIKIPKLTGSSFRGWTFVLVAGVVLTVLALLDRGGAADLIPGHSTANGSTGCIMQVMTD